MTVTTIVEFWEHLAKAHLLDDAEVQRLHDAHAMNGGDSAQEVAEKLIESSVLTSWQAGMLLAGRTQFFLGRYKLLDKLGEGGMGAVFKADQQPLGRIVALKVVSEKYLANENALARFRREIQAAAALDHPNIVRAYDADSVGGTHFLVMEYVEGIDLATLAKRRGPDARRRGLLLHGTSCRGVAARPRSRHGASRYQTGEPADYASGHRA